MKLIPPPAPADPSATKVEAGIVSGLTSACVMCGHSTVTYWDNGAFHPLHRTCISRLLAYWRESTEDGESSPAPESAPAAAPTGRRTGAYARRAKSAATPEAPAKPARSAGGAFAPVIPEQVRANRFFRPGMPAGAPWTVVGLTEGTPFAMPCWDDEAKARQLAGRWRQQADSGVPLSLGKPPLLGVRLVAPDGTTEEV